MKSTPPASFTTATQQLGLDITPDQQDALAAYLDLLLTANEQFNLTAIRNPEEAWQRHILESLALLPHLDENVCTLADVGSGGGLPGLPLAIMRPDLQICLIESIGKKAQFLDTACRELGLPHVRVLNQRAEILGQDPAFRETFDVVTAKAVSALPVLLELCIPLLRVNGILLAFKGQKHLEEIKAAQHALERLRAMLLRCAPLCPEQNTESVLLAIEKRGATPKAYPRLPGVPGKIPL